MTSSGIGVGLDDSAQLRRLPDRLRQILDERGVADEEIVQALSTGQLHFLAVDALLGPPGQRFTLDELAAQSGIDAIKIRVLWRALGFADVSPQERHFSELDVDAAQIIRGLLGGGTEFDVAIQLARVIGSSMARIAEAEVVTSALGAVGPNVESDDLIEVADHFSRFAASTAPAVPQLLGYVWLRHLHAISTRYLLARDRGVFEASELELAVGFLDLVGFTVLSQQLTTIELSKIVSRFEALAYDSVARLGGRVVKMIGDEVMFVADTAAAAAEICLTLKEAYGTEETLSEVRAGIAYGKVLTRDGDYYGNVVNLASRIVNIAKPGSLLISDTLHEALIQVQSYAMKPLRVRFLKDFGNVHLWVLRRSEESLA
ncbi:MAG: adenylate/guanylate cyclase domain-containing protein, partial [Acidimicrobiales bacterium]